MRTNAAAIIACRNVSPVRKQRRSVRARRADSENYLSVIVVTVNAQQPDDVNGMRIDIKTDGIEVTEQMKERLDWICSKLEKMADTKDPDQLHCDIVVSQTAGSTGDGEFVAKITFFDDSGVIREAKSAAENPLAALDIAHAEIERKYFQERRAKQEKQRIKNFSNRRAILRKKAAEEKKKGAEEYEPRRKGIGTEEDEE